MNHKLGELSNAIIAGNHIAAEELTKYFVGNGTDPLAVLNEGLMPGMEVVGRRFKDGLIFLPNVLVAARAMKTSMTVLEPLLAKGSYRSKGKIVLGTVKGDVHDIGKNLVAIMLRGAGYEVIDIGVGCSADQFIEAVEKHKPDVVGLSALLTTTMLYMGTVIEKLSDRGVNVPVIVGGAPVNSAFADKIHAAGYARNASEAVVLVGSLLNSGLPKQSND